MRHLVEKDLENGKLSRLPRFLPRRFFVKEDGTITVFALMMFVLMVGVGGIAIDVMRYETQRAQLQYTLDRAVLAAASLTQTRDPESVVREYFEAAGFAGYRISIDVNSRVNCRRVTANVEMEMQNIFMNLFGQRVLTSPASGAAEDCSRNIEVSLALDVSGSMRDNSRIANLRPAARQFVTSMLAANDNPEGRQRVSISIVPYNGYVNVGTTLASVFSLTDEHNYSRCARFYNDDFTVSGLDPTVPIQRMGHYDRVSNERPRWGRSIRNPDCPTNDESAILPWSNNEAALHGMIDDLQADGWTSIDTAARWGVALLDPLARPALSGLVTNGTVHQHFDGRPSSYLDPDTVKVLVLMTDGANTRQFDLHERYREGPSPFWRDPDDGDLSVYYEVWDQYWHRDHNVWRRFPDGGGNSNAVQLDYADLWNYVPAGELAEDLFSRDSWELNWNRYSNVNRWRRSTIEAMAEDFQFSDIINNYADEFGTVEGDVRLRNLCDVAHANDILIFSIAFEAPEEGEAVMRYCASSDAHYYNVNGLDISEAFASIAQAINRLRLVQ